MKLELARVQFSGEGSWEDVEEKGTLISLLGKGDKFKFSDTNLKSDKAVTLFITEKGKENEAPKMLPCSKKLSTTVRTALKNGVQKKSILGALAQLNVIQNEKGMFLVPPFGGADAGFTVEEVAKEAVDYQELVAF